MPRNFKRKRPRQTLGEEKTEVITVGKKARSSGWGKSARSPWSKKLREALRKEPKYLDTSRTTVEINYDAVHANSLNIIPTGDTQVARDGNRVKMTGIQIKGVLKYAGLTAFDCQIRMFLVYDKRANGAGNPGLSEVIGSGGAATDVYQLRNRLNSTRFKVLKDEYFSFAQKLGYNESTGSQLLPFEWFLPIDALVEYSASSGSSTDVRVGNLVLFAFSDIAAASTGPTIEYSARVSFEDF